MKIRHAKQVDLKPLKLMFKDIVNKMNKNNINIWDDVYPIEFLKEDIDNHCLYIVENNENELVAAFALCSSNQGNNEVCWENQTASALYLERFGVNIHHLGKDYGRLTILFALKEANKLGTEYLRLFVVENNIPAISLYKKVGFKQAKGIFKQVIDEDLSFNEIGFEIRLGD